MPVENKDVYKVLVGYSPIGDSAIINIFSNSRLENDRLVSVDHYFQVDDTPGIPAHFGIGFSDHNIEDQIRNVTVYHYTSPASGIEALLLPFTGRSARAVFSLDNVNYILHVEAGIRLMDDEDFEYNLDVGRIISAVDLLKEIIDAYYH